MIRFHFERMSQLSISWTSRWFSDFFKSLQIFWLKNKYFNTKESAKFANAVFKVMNEWMIYNIWEQRQPIFKLGSLVRLDNLAMESLGDRLTCDSSSAFFNDESIARNRNSDKRSEIIATKTRTKLFYHRFHIKYEIKIKIK